MGIGEELQWKHENTVPKTETQEQIEEKWGIGFEEMDKWDITVDRKKEPECIVGTDDQGRKIEVSHQSSVVDGVILAEEDAQALYSKVFKIWSAKVDRWKMEEKRDKAKSE